MTCGASFAIQDLQSCSHCTQKEVEDKTASNKLYEQHIDPSRNKRVIIGVFF